MPRKHASSTMLVKNVRNTTVPANQRIVASSKNRIRKLIRNRSRYARRSGIGSLIFVAPLYYSTLGASTGTSRARAALRNRANHASAFGEHAGEHLGNQLIPGFPCTPIRRGRLASSGGRIFLVRR